MYDGKTQFLIENPINRYLINSPMLPGMKTNSDGSLTLYIQLVMRLYWPKETPPSILPPGKGTWQPPGVVAAS
jgi:hypothetical protein